VGVGDDIEAPPVLKKPPLATVCFATTLATTSGRFDLFRIRINTDDSFKWKSGVDNKRIPTLIATSPPRHQLGLQSPLSATAKIISKYAAIRALLLLCVACTSFLFIFL
jgi:hypothetical protein